MIVLVIFSRRMALSIVCYLSAFSRMLGFLGCLQNPRISLSLVQKCILQVWRESESDDTGIRSFNDTFALLD